jgi:hypothetical protein
MEGGREEGVMQQFQYLFSVLLSALLQRESYMLVPLCLLSLPPGGRAGRQTALNATPRGAN